MGRPRDELQSAQSLDSFMKFAFFIVVLSPCVCVCVISPRNKIVCKPGRVLFIAIVVACCRSSCCRCCCCLKVCFFDSFRGVLFLCRLCQDLVVAVAVAVDNVAFPAWQSVKTLSKLSSVSASASASVFPISITDAARDRASKDVN